MSDTWFSICNRFHSTATKCLQFHFERIDLEKLYGDFCIIAVTFLIYFKILCLLLKQILKSFNLEELRKWFEDLIIKKVAMMLFIIVTFIGFIICSFLILIINFSFKNLKILISMIFLIIFIDLY